MLDISEVRDRSLVMARSLSGMGMAAPQPFDPSLLQEGTGLRAVSGKAQLRGMVQVRRGFWIDHKEWQVLTSAQQHAAKIHATAWSSSQEMVFSHLSAAVLWGLPLIGRRLTSVHVTSGRHATALAGVTRHAYAEEPEWVEHRGLWVTSPARTVVDVARLDFYSGLACADQALRLGLATLEEIDAEAAAVPARAPGRRRALFVARLGDPLSMSAGESYSRGRMFVHGVPRPMLQVELVDVDGVIGLGDFAWDEESLDGPPRTTTERCHAVGEFDGMLKYRASPGQTPADASAVVTAEKLREDRIRRLGIQVVRWTWNDVHRERPFLQILGGIGIVPRGRASWGIE